MPHTHSLGRPPPSPETGGAPWEAPARAAGPGPSDLSQHRARLLALAWPPDRPACARAHLRGAGPVPVHMLARGAPSGPALALTHPAALHVLARGSRAQGAGSQRAQRSHLEPARHACLLPPAPHEDPGPTGRPPSSAGSEDKRAPPGCPEPVCVLTGAHVLTAARLPPRDPQHRREPAGSPAFFSGCLPSLARPRGQASESGYGQAPAPGKGAAVRMGPREATSTLGDLGSDVGSRAPLVSAKIRAEPAPTCL